MVKSGDRYNRCVYSYEFPDNHVYVGITYNFQRRRIDRESKPNDTVTRYINKTGLQPIHRQLTDYLLVKEAVFLEAEFVEGYRNRGWEILNIVKTGGIGGDILYWTKERCIEESLKYNTRKDFNLHSKGAYDACRRNGWLEDVYKHMIGIRKPNNYWTKENCLKEARKYNTIQEFSKAAGGAYDKIKKNNWSEDCFAHMKFSKHDCYRITVL